MINDIMKQLLFILIIFNLQSLAQKNNKNQLSETAHQKLDAYYIEATKQKILGNYIEASVLFNKCLSIDPINHAAMYELADIYLEQGQNVAALNFAQAAARLNPDNEWYQQLYAEVLEFNNDYKSAAKVYEGLIEKYPEELKYYFDWIHLLVATRQYEDAIKGYNRLEQKIGIDENIIDQKVLLYVKLNKINKATAEIKKLIDAHPNKPQYYKKLGDLYQANDMNEKALNAYEQLLKLDPHNPYGQLALAKYYQKKDDQENYLTYLKLAFANERLNIDSKRSILLPTIELIGKDSVLNPISQEWQLVTNKKEAKENAFMLVKILIQTHPHEPKSYAIYGDILYRDKQPEQALRQYLKANQLDDSRFAIWQQILFINSQLEEFDTLDTYSQQAIELFPNQPLFYLYNGIAKIQLKQYQQAISPTNQVIKLSTDNKALLAQSYSNLGDIYHYLKQHHSSDSCYRLSLSFDPDNAYVLNNFSYYLSLRTESLEEAKQMSKKSNELIANNSSFLDTYGWILYVLKDYEGAKEWLEKAIENGGDTRPVILEHYGDVLHQLKQVDKAVEYWKKAKEKGADSELIDKKIKNIEH